MRFSCSFSMKLFYLDNKMHTLHSFCSIYTFGTSGVFRYCVFDADDKKMNTFWNRNSKFE